MLNKFRRQSRLGAAECDAILAMPYRLANVDRGAYLVHEGDKIESCCLLLTGFAYRSKLAGSGARQILSIHLPGDLVDLQNSLLEEADHDVQALTDVRVALIPHQAVLDVSEAYPDVACALWRDTLVDGSIFREWLLNVGQRNARQRIAHLLCELALRQEAAGICERPYYQWPMTQEQIADATGLTAVHVNRTLQQMRADGLISMTKGSMQIHDMPALRRAGDFAEGYLHQRARPLPA